MKLRYEDFGAIIALDDPPALVHVDQAFVRSLGYPDSPRWDAPKGHLSAPTEVHVMLTERCPAGCPSCYVDALPESTEPSTADWKRVLEQLADMGVFHVAMGGGESMLRADLFELAEYARELGLVPNLTTSGIGMSRERAEACHVFGQVNVSLDGLGEVYVASRGYDGAERALRSLRLLRRAGVSCGINAVVSRTTLPSMTDTIDAALDAGATEVELLRFKPAGRAHLTYFAERLDEAGRRSLLPTVIGWMKRWPQANIKIDCSFVPFLCAADPNPELLHTFGVLGCEAGHVLSAVRADLSATACSFIEQPVGSVEDFVRGWDDDPHLMEWRNYSESPPRPCAECAYRQICRGGCKAVTNAHESTYFAPDPECPRVVAWRRGEPFVPTPV